MTIEDVLRAYLRGLSCRHPREVAWQLRALREALGSLEVDALTVEDLDRYRAARVGAGRSHTTVNRELAYLRAALRRAEEGGILERIPVRIRLPREDNARSDFLTVEQMGRVAEELPAPLGDLVRFMFWSGWRTGVATRLRWSSVRWARGVIVQDAHDAKNGRPLVVPIAGPLLEVLERRRADELGPWVFHRSGRPIRCWRKAWENATARAGVPGVVRHALRRSMASHYLEAGVPEEIIMRIAGWRTRVAFSRYAILRTEPLRDAIELAAARE